MTRPERTRRAAESETATPGGSLRISGTGGKPRLAAGSEPLGGHVQPGEGRAGYFRVREREDDFRLVFESPIRVKRRRALGLAGSPGHIRGAVSLPFSRVSTDYPILHQYDTVIVYGKDYNDPVAEGMSKRLIELGVSDVRTLRGGLRAWESAGNELATGKPDDS